jgi:hypothetical protein
VTTSTSVAGPQSREIRERNRRVLRVLLGIVASLAAGALLIGIRW